MFLKKYTSSWLASIVAIVAILCVCGSANAYDYPADYSSAAKTVYIDQARAGDAEAFYQLGLMHLHGLGSAHNKNVARSFFTHASEKGHIKAANALATITPRPEVNTHQKPNPDISSSKAEKDRLSKRDSIQAAKIAKRKDVAEQKRLAAAERKAERQAIAKAKRQAAKEAKLQARESNNQKPGQQNSATLDGLKLEKTNLTPKEEPSIAPTTPKDSHVKIASSNPKSLPSVGVQSEQVDETDPNSLIKGLLTILLLLLMLVAMLLMGRRIGQK